MPWHLYVDGVPTPDSPWEASYVTVEEESAFNLTAYVRDCPANVTFNVTFTSQAYSQGPTDANITLKWAFRLESCSYALTLVFERIGTNASGLYEFYMQKDDGLLYILQSVRLNVTAASPGNYQGAQPKVNKYQIHFRFQTKITVNSSSLIKC